MSRYIEIIFDDSGSMTTYIDGKPKYDIAKQMFNDNVLPQLGKKGDELILRTLRKGCDGISKETQFFSKNKLKDAINGIHDFYNNTPLYLTLADSIKACSKSDKVEKFIFVLTDGDDNCYKPLNEILTPKLLKEKEKINTEIILVQFAVNSKISQNNLNALSQRIGAKNVVISGKDTRNAKTVKSKLGKAFINTGMDTDGNLEHCFDELPDDNYKLDFKILELLDGIDFYLVELLYQEKLLSWKPIFKKHITKTQFAELDFLYTLRFRNSLPETLVKQMLSQLKKPYKYTHDCIFWDFKLRKWRYYEKPEEIHVLPNPEARDDDNQFTEKLEEENDLQTFNRQKIYRIEYHEEIGEFIIKENQYDCMGVKEINTGDCIKFTK